MNNRWKTLSLFAAACLLAGAVYAGISKQQADMMTTPHDPKKKKAGMSCKSSEECQKHHSCEKVGEKSVCVAPEVREIPNT